MKTAFSLSRTLLARSSSLAMPREPLPEPSVRAFHEVVFAALGGALALALAGALAGFVVEALGDFFHEEHNREVWDDLLSEVDSQDEITLATVQVADDVVRRLLPQSEADPGRRRTEGLQQVGDQSGGYRVEEREPDRARRRGEAQ
mgnify:CR=1 FL=1